MTNIPRLYIDTALIAGETIPLNEAQGKYLTRVMRLVDGAIVRAFDGRNGEWRCVLRSEGRRAALEPLEQIRKQVDALALSLLFTPVKKARTNFIVEKACELGVRDIWPVITQFTQTERVRTDRLQAVVIEAAEQTERMDIPLVHAPQALPKALVGWDPAIPLYFCDEGGDAKPMRAVLERDAPRLAGILIGPEGGFAPKEREILRSLDFVIPVTLGPRILRAETAVVSALTLWQSLVGDWQQAPYLPES